MGMAITYNVDALPRATCSPFVGRFYRLGRQWCNPLHIVVKIEGRRVYSESPSGETGTCLPIWLWRRKYHSLANVKSDGAAGCGPNSP